MPSYLVQFTVKSSSCSQEVTIVADNSYLARKAVELQYLSAQDIHFTGLFEGTTPTINLVSTSEFIPMGQRVAKLSGKPFKSGLKINTVKSYSVHPVTTRPTYHFFEDESYVEVKQCTHELPSA